MSIWNKILLGLIFIASLGFFHAAARTVKTYQYWTGQVAKFESTLKQRNEQIVLLRTGDREPSPEDKTKSAEQLRIDAGRAIAELTAPSGGTACVQQLRTDLGRVLANRGRVWAKCEKKGGVTPDPQHPGILKVNVSPDDSFPNTVAPHMLLYAFEEGDDQSPGKYLGEFQVTHVGATDRDRQIELTSTGQMVKAFDPKIKSLLDNVVESKGPWVLYEVIPTDENEAFEGLTDDQKKLVPPALLEKGRPLHDYLAVFRSCETYRTLFADRMESITRDLKYLNDAKQDAENEEALTEKEKSQVALEQKRAHKERDAVVQHYEALQRLLANNLAAVKAAITNNLFYAQQIAKLQKDAAEAIDRRTRSMAQFGPGAN